MAELKHQNKACNNSIVNGSLKLFGFNVMELDQAHEKKSVKTTSESSNSSGFSTSDKQKYECQYYRREFANSQVLDGHQNTHKKERQQLSIPKCKPIETLSFPTSATLWSLPYPRRPTSLPQPVSFKVASKAAPSWVYTPQAGQPFHMSCGCAFPAPTNGTVIGTPSYTDSVGDSSLSNVGPQQPVKAYGGRLDGPSLSRFSRVDDGPISDDVFGLDLQLSLAPLSLATFPDLFN